MKKLLIGSLSLVAALSLNAAVYATVNGEEITDGDIAILMQVAPEQVSFNSLPEDAKKQLLDQAIERKLLTAYAKKEGIENDENYKKALAQVKNEIALESWMKNIFDKVKPEEADMKKFYDDNVDRFVQPARVKVRHILVKEESDAANIINEVKNLKGDELKEKFIALAKERSIEPNASQSGGDLGWFAKGEMVESFSNASFALESGEVSKMPVKTQFGYHVILSEGKEADQKVSYDRAKGQIENILKMEIFRVQVANQASKLREGAQISIKK